MAQHEGALTGFAKTLRKYGTDAEQKLWRQLRGRQLCNAKFRRQHPVPPYIVDFVCLEKRLIIEADGGQHIDQRRHDDRRTAFLEAQSFRVLRFWNHEKLEQTDAVLGVILRALEEAAAPHPGPLLGGERE